MRRFLGQLLHDVAASGETVRYRMKWEGAATKLHSRGGSAKEPWCLAHKGDKTHESSACRSCPVLLVNCCLLPLVGHHSKEGVAGAACQQRLAPLLQPLQRTLVWQLDALDDFRVGEGIRGSHVRLDQRAAAKV